MPSAQKSFVNFFSEKSKTKKCDDIRTDDAPTGVALARYAPRMENKLQTDAQTNTKFISICNILYINAGVDNITLVLYDIYIYIFSIVRYVSTKNVTYDNKDKYVMLSVTLHNYANTEIANVKYVDIHTFN